ncbi:stAR-related lipid transfer protein 7, mitochondrial-like [Phoenix dactylifera]|uniref:StAR-related lipid transfer protein 7, mitochondrial-like n=1 Tax=Phoenix dactylifera TaxID=42345 RepID=A0A8B7BTN0_PHODC|nr:stAR-related lipid transfer protein 7, mitochondrial-like [Phoenix dactylifera]
MTLTLDALIGILGKPAVGDGVAELALVAAPLWIAVLVGLFVGWAWRPRWAASLVGGEKASLGGRRLPPSKTSSVDSLKAQLPSSISSPVSGKSFGKEENMAVVSPADGESEKLAVTEEDLEHLCQLVEVTDGGPVWHKMMDRSLPSMSYQAWRRDPKVGPSQYRSRTVFEDATPEIVRDFFWDDEFRIKNGWDDMLLYHEILKECPKTGTAVVHWIRKFPFFCSDREYTIGRRIWDLGRTYYCVTKGVPCHSIPRRNKPRRVDLYYSSWCIRAVESRRGDGQLTACEVLLFHHEDMGIPREIAKLGVRQGMWGCVKRIEPGLRAYQIARRSDEPLSQSAVMAQINTKLNADDLRSSEVGTCSSLEIVEAEKQKHWAGNIPKFLVIGGAVALACTLDHGLLTKAVIFGVARRFAKQGRRL